MENSEDIELRYNPRLGKMLRNTHKHNSAGELTHKQVEQKYVDFGRKYLDDHRQNTMKYKIRVLYDIIAAVGKFEYKIQFIKMVYGKDMVTLSDKVKHIFSSSHSGAKTDIDGEIRKFMQYICNNYWNNLTVFTRADVKALMVYLRNISDVEYVILPDTNTSESNITGDDAFEPRDTPPETPSPEYEEYYSSEYEEENIDE